MSFDLKQLLNGTDLSYNISYTYSRPTSAGKCVNDVLLVSDHQQYILYSCYEYTELLYFYGINDDDSRNTDGLSACKQLLDLISSNEHKSCIIDQYLKLCQEQPMLYLYLKDIHTTLLDNPLACMNNIKNFIANYKRMRDYLIDVLSTPFQQLENLAPLYLVMVNESIANKNGQQSIFFELHEYYQSFGKSDHIHSLGDFVKNKTARSNDIAINQMYAVYVEFILYLITNEYILKKCPRCNKYFIAKYYSSTIYCNNIYKNTKETCQQLAAIQKYSNKKKGNPIYAEYMTCYNKLYARARRGTIAADSDIFQKLCSLRDEYMQKYSENPTENTVNEFSERLKLFSSKNKKASNATVKKKH